MSKEIICPQCQTANAPGSKFCNNCGNRLPPSTSLICPNCGTPNPRDRFYCDSCGSRLVKNSPMAKKPEEKPKPPPQTGTFFSLPARPPGQTGELDPLQIVPDWLKKQAGEPHEEQSEEDLRQHMPKIEEVGPPKKATDDLPEWLIDEHDSEPFIGSPRIITTEHFMNLVRPSEDDEAEDLAETADKAELPEWLTDLTGPLTGDKTAQSEDLSTPDDALNEWLSSISGGDESEEFQADEAENPAHQPTGFDEFDEFPEGTDQAEEKEKFTTDWLFGAAMETADSDREMPDTDSMAGLDAEDPALGSEMFDWLAENLVDTGALDQTAVEASGPEISKADEDLLPDFTAAADEELTPSTATSDEEARETVTGWLYTEDLEQTNAGDMDEFADAADLQEADAGDQDLPGWITEIYSEGEEKDVSSTPESQPDWMAEFTTADSEALAQELEFKLEALEESAESGSEIEAEGDFHTGFTDALNALAEEGSKKSDEFALPDESDVRGPGEELEPGNLSGAELEPMPDWLSDLGGGESLVTDSDSGDAIFTDLFTLPETDSGDLDWISAEESETESDLVPAVDEVKPAITPTDMEWLSELEAMGDQAFAVEETEAVEDTAVTDEPQPAAEEPEPAPSDVFAADWPDEDGDETEAESDAEPDILSGDLFSDDTMLREALGEELPDWLDELGAPVTDAMDLDLDSSITSAENMPDWIAQMKPGSGFGGIGMTESSGLTDLTESFSDLSGDLVGAELPNWLLGAAEMTAASLLPLEEAMDIPDWLAESIPLESEFAEPASRPAEHDSEWTAVLQDLPPAAPIQERVFKADIPDWILALKPTSLPGESAEEGQVQEAGPLAGIRDVIEIEPVIGGTRLNGAMPVFTASPEQLSQATLLKQLALANKGAARSFRRTETSSFGLVRLLLAGLLLFAIVLGLLRPSILRVVPAAAPSAYLSAAHSAIEAAAGEPVLLAVEYTPALAGELDVQAEMILAQLAANGSTVVTVSQSAAGTAVAQRIAAENPTLGMLPGQSVGLRQLGQCLGGSRLCTTLTGKSITGTVQQSLSGAALIIVLTGERDSLTNWLEQVAISNDIPVVAGVTQSLAPVALPYLDSAQLQGMIGGLPDTAVYQQTLLNQTPDNDIMRQLTAQTLAQLLAAVLLLIGGIIFGTAHLLKRGGTV